MGEAWGWVLGAKAFEAGFRRTLREAVASFVTSGHANVNEQKIALPDRRFFGGLTAKEGYWTPRTGLNLVAQI